MAFLLVARTELLDLTVFSSSRSQVRPKLSEETDRDPDKPAMASKSVFKSVTITVDGTTGTTKAGRTRNVLSFERDA